MKKTNRHNHYNELKGELYKKGITYEAAAVLLNISTAGFNRKINGPSDFTVREAMKLASACGFEPSIFFDAELQNATKP